MGCRFQHVCLNALMYDQSCGVSKHTEPMVARHDLTNTSIRSSEDYLSPPPHSSSQKISYVPVPSFITVCAIRRDQVQHSQKTSLKPFSK